MIEGGQVVFKDTMQAFNNYIAPDSLIVSLENAPSTEVLKMIPGITAVEQVEDKTYRLHFDDATRISEKVVLKSVEDGWRLTEINLEKVLSTPSSLNYLTKDQVKQYHEKHI